jgi:uncharacterized membrane protein YdjX (TVP38/TMEM64 family)
MALFIVAASIGAFLWVGSATGVNVFSEEGLAALAAQLGPWGPLAYMALLTLSVVISQIPGVPLAIAAGALWGPLAAGAYSVIGGFTGGLIAYFLGRTLGRSAIRVLIGKVVYFTRDRGEYYLGWLIFTTRLLPVFSFDVISYAAGVTRLSLPIYALATFFGMIPPTFGLTYLGSRFTVSAPRALGLSGAAAVLLVLIPWLAQRYNWLGLKDLMRIE